MAAKPAKKAAAKGGSELIISKSRTKAAARKCTCRASSTEPSTRRSAA